MKGNEHNKSWGSIVITALIGTAILIIIVGLVLTVMGFVGPLFEVSYKDFSFRTSSTGLALIAIGSVLGAYVSTRLPPHVRPFFDSGPEPRERFRRWAPPLFALIALAAIITFVVALLGAFR